tara:strand:- start:2375 stop:2530 length:156 start_codon:yes stop_codon:yes gene_type:complete
MSDSDDPCDDVVGTNLPGWIKRDSSNPDSKLQQEDKSGDRYTDSWVRFEHD